jgi:hypothetical protein
MNGSLMQACEAQDPQLANTLRDHAAKEPVHYQNCLGGLLAEHHRVVGHPLSVLETGVRWALSTDSILTELDAQNDGGTLVSVDPFTLPGLYAIKHPKWELVAALSKDFLTGLVGRPETAYDVFLHDSDHEVWCQTFEYEVAWYLVNPGGIIATDDSRWGPHGAWLSFAARHGQNEMARDNLRYIYKPLNAKVLRGKDLGGAIFVARSLADAALAAWKFQGGPFQ